MIRLGINIDHIATVRNARKENDPSILEMLFEIQSGGADNVTMHLREDRRHILDSDVWEIKKHSKIPINFEMALTKEMIDIALQLKPKSVCIVPEKREELTTEGGLNISLIYDKLKEVLVDFLNNEIQVFLFLDPNTKNIDLCSKLQISGVEIFTGTFSRMIHNNYKFPIELGKIQDVAKVCLENNIEFHAGHGLNYHNIQHIKNITNPTEVNIGHSIIARSFKIGLRTAVQEMKRLLEN